MKIVSQENEYGVLMTDIEGKTIFIDYDLNDEDPACFSVYAGNEEEATMHEGAEFYCPVWLGNYKTKDEAVSVIRSIAEAVNKDQKIFYMPEEYGRKGKGKIL